MTTHEERKQRADESSAASYWFSYVLELDDGSYYPGSTVAPFARWTEHAVDAGAKATIGHKFTVRAAWPFLTRREAEYNEKRLHEALNRSPKDLKALLAVFDQVMNAVRPQKTLAELHEEEVARIRASVRANWHLNIGSTNPGQIQARGLTVPQEFRHALSRDQWNEMLRSVARELREEAEVAKARAKVAEYEAKAKG